MSPTAAMAELPDSLVPGDSHELEQALVGAKPAAEPVAADAKAEPIETQGEPVTPEGHDPETGEVPPDAEPSDEQLSLGQKPKKGAK